MAEGQSPQVEIAPTIIVSNSEGIENDTSRPNSGTAHSNGGDETPHSNGSSSQSEPQLDGNLVALSEQPAIAIAAIEAERDIELATISASVERERIGLDEQRIEVIEESNKELEECRMEIQKLTEQVEELRLLIQPPVLAEAIAELSEIVLEQNMIQPSIAAPTLETMTEPSGESVEERVEEIIPSRVRKFIAI